MAYITVVPQHLQSINGPPLHFEAPVKMTWMTRAAYHVTAPTTYEFTGVEDDDAARYAHILIRPTRPLAQFGVKKG